jgi:hypothetical protein
MSAAQINLNNHQPESCSTDGQCFAALAQRSLGQLRTDTNTLNLDSLIYPSPVVTGRRGLRWWLHPRGHTRSHSEHGR